MELAALIGLSSPTLFINSGQRHNMGRRASNPHSHTVSGVLVGSVGARFEKKNRMEWKYCIVSKEQNTRENGYGQWRWDDLDGELDRQIEWKHWGPEAREQWKSKVRKLRAWAQFYGLTHLPLYDEAQAHVELSRKEAGAPGPELSSLVRANPDASFQSLGRDLSMDPYLPMSRMAQPNYFHCSVFVKRMKAVLLPFLIDANDRGFVDWEADNDAIGSVSGGQEKTQAPNQESEGASHASGSSWKFWQRRNSRDKKEKAEELNANKRALESLPDTPAVHRPLPRLSTPRPVVARLVGLGLGVWKIFHLQNELFIRACLELLERYPLPALHTIEFLWVADWSEEDERRILRAFRPHHENRNVKIIFTHGNPADPLFSIKRRGSKGASILEAEQQAMQEQFGGLRPLLVTMYAWDGNSYPGNEYWLGLLSASGDPAAACCSLIAELQNPQIHPEFMQPERVFIANSEPKMETE